MTLYINSNFKRHQTADPPCVILRCRGLSRAARRWGPPVNTTGFHDLQQSNECNRLLDMPRIALMFLSRGDMYHEGVWAKWFAGAKGLIPKPTLQASCLV